MTNVIIVDDDQTNVGLTQMLLEMDGFHATACMDLESAIQATGADTDAFVVDWHLARNISGLELLKAVRQGKTNAAANTVFIITSGDHRRSGEALEFGANHFLLKPYPPDQLSKILRDLLA
jgi:PleD family two-component response regulator